MSEFTCRNGHIVTGYSCDICGGKITHMDGMSEREIQAEEEAWERNQFEMDLDDYDQEEE